MGREDLPPNTGPLRTQIGLARKRLEDAIKDVNDILVAAKQATTTPELIDIRDRLPDVDAVMTDRHGHLAELDIEWQNICMRSTAESRLRQTWLTEYGDFNDVLDQAEEVHREAKIVLASICKSIHHLGKDKPNPPLIRRRQLSPLPANSDTESTVRMDVDPFHKPYPVPTPRRLEPVPTAMAVHRSAAPPSSSKPKMALPDVPSNKDKEVQRPSTPSVPDRLNQPEDHALHQANNNQTGNQAGLHNALYIHGSAPISPFLTTLPPLHIEHFSGDSLSFPQFWALFNTTIHSTPDHILPPVLKFSHLVSYLEGAAKEAVAGLSITGENYEVAVKILKSRFGKPAIIQQNLLRILQNITPSSGSTASLRHTIDEVEKTVRQLDTYSTDKNSLMESVILAKFPDQAVTAILRAKERTSNWSIDKVMDTLNRFVDERETVEALCAKTNNRNPNIHRAHPSLETTVPRQETSHRPLRCVFCDQPHLNKNCAAFATADSRARQAAARGLCFICLQAHTSPCRSERRCRKCNSPSHCRILCRNATPFAPTFTPIQSKPNRSTGGNAEPLGRKTVPSPNRPTFCGKEPTVEASFITTAEKASVLKPPCGTVLVCPLHLTHQVNSVTYKAHVHAICDSGACTTYISTRLANHLQLELQGERKIVCTSFGSNQTTSAVCRVYQLPLRTIEDKVIYLEALGRDSLCAPISSTAVHEKARAFDLTDNTFTPQILFSNNDFWMLVTGGPQDDGEHRFLPSVIGPIFLPTSSKNTSLPNTTTAFLTADTPVSTKIEVNYTQNHYSVKLPFQLNKEPENDHYFLALHRLRSIYKNLEQKPEVLEEYNEQIQKLIDNKVAEVVPSFYPNSEDEFLTQRFLAHHPTYHPQKQKMRIVFDGSARTKYSKSINEMLETGENLLPKIRELLIEMRSLKRFLIADIKSAFHNVIIDPDHRRFLKFIWLKNHKRPPLSSNLMYLQFAKLPFGLTCSPFILVYCLREHLHKYHEFGKQIAKRAYVDNLLIEFDDFTDAVTKVKEMHRIFSEASMPLHEFMSNDEEVNQFLAQEGNEIKSPASFLGVKLDFDTDEFIYTIPPLQDQLLTKRRVSSILSSVFDPLGVLEPVLLPIKRFLQRLWMANIPWDIRLTEDLADEFKSLTATWGTTEIHVARLYDVKGAMDINLHGFADASKHAKGAVCFLTLKLANGTQSVHFVASKSRLSPTKIVQSIPVLEFSAILLTAQLMHEIKRALPNIKIESTLWSDNSAALHWAMKDSLPNSPIYVKNRHAELTKLLKGVDIKHVPGIMNPADVVSRGCSLQQLSNNPDWMKGPQWLLNKDLWPAQPFDTLNIIDDPAETNSAAMLTTTVQKVPSLPWTTFSSWKKVTRIASLCLTFLAMKSPTFAQRFNLNKLRSPSTNEVERSRLIFPLLLKGIQAENPPTAKERNGWALFEDNTGLLRQRTRVRLAADPAITLNPIFMPRDHPLTRAYLFQIHERHAHSSREYTYNAARNHVFIPKARPVINNIIRSCYHCKRFHARPFKLPPYPPFPEERTQPSSPFTHTGVDLLGPIYLKPTNMVNNDNQRRRGRPPAPVREKAYAVIFACFSTRAIHLELVNNQTPEAFLHAFRRFCSRRGAPQTLLSDQALNFTTTAALFTADPSTGSYQPISSMSAFLTNANINWRFTPALAPWNGAVYERLIHTVKTSFHRSIGRRILDVESCRTLLTEVELNVNKRPITYVSSENSKTLTPADFLNLTQNDPPYVENENNEPNSINDADFNPDGNDESGRHKLLKLWQFASDLTTRFWNFWKHSYITQLQSRLQTEHHQPRLVNNEAPKPNEIVLINDDSLPRNAWKLGRITALHSTPYRSATIEVGQPNGKTHQVSRPINKLSSLELRAFSTILVLFSLCTFGNACSEIASLSATSRECTQTEDDTLSCGFSSSVRFALTPKTHELCLQFKYEENDTVASELLIINPNSLQLTCAPTTLGYSSDVKFHTAYSHRCDRAVGSQCFDNFCESVTKQTSLTDLTNEANEHFGYSYCYRSCGWCDGCGLVSPSCLFYRTYIMADSANYFHLFNCLSFLPKTTLTITQGNTSDILDLTPTFSQTFQEIVFTVSSTSINPLPILHQTFLTNLLSNETFLLPVSVLASDPNPLTVSCTSPDAAKSANCSFTSDHCRCTPDNFNPHCTCLNFDFSTAEKSNPKLPVAREGTTLSLVDNNLIANTTQPIELQITVNKTIDMVIQLTTCQIAFVNISGCYNCEETPTISLTCHTSYGRTTVTIACDTVDIEAFLCTANSTLFNLPLTSKSAEIDENCRVRCSRTITKLHVYGQLGAKIIHPNNGDESDQDNIMHDSSGFFGDIWRSITKFFDNFISNYKLILLIVGLLAILGLLIIAGFYARPIFSVIYHCCFSPRPTAPTFERHVRLRLSRLS